MDISAIRITTDEAGNPIVVLPLAVWQDLLSQLHLQPHQDDQIKAILRRWKSEPDDTTPEWWDAFDMELKANRTTFHGANMSTDES